jgi:hypothetical protein
VKLAAAIASVALVVLFIALETLRISLLLLLIVGSSTLASTAYQQPRRFCGRLMTVAVLCGVLAAVPVDVRLYSTGRPGARVLPIVWGYPTPASLERVLARELILGGCVVPFNPPAYILVVSF